MSERRVAELTVAEGPLVQASVDSRHTLADHIDALLPQTQCTQCGFDGCRPYAEAIADGSASIDRCPPGGAAGIAALARLLGLAEAPPLNPQHGCERARRVAFIVESLCIGCTKCIDACPVDAIVGAPKRMHAVIAELCTGCDLCVAPCPVDCIEMRDTLPDGAPVAAWTHDDAREARTRHAARKARLERDREAEAARLSAEYRKREVVAAAIARARDRAARSRR